MRTTDDEIDRLIPCSAGRKAMGLSRTSAWRRERSDPTFPQRIQIGHNSYRYRLGDVRRWIAGLPVVKRGTTR